MSVLALTDARIYADGANVSGYANRVELSADSEALDSTTFASAGWREKTGGLAGVQSMVGGFFQAGDATMPDDRFFADLGVANVPYTVTPTAAAVGDVSYFTKLTRLAYKLGGDVSGLSAFESAGVGSGVPLVRGKIANSTARTATATTTAIQLATPGAAQKVYCALHVLAVSGTTPSMTVTLQGDNGSGFPSPATVATSSALSGVGSTWLAGAAGVTVDDWYRLSLVISGTSPSFLFVASIGIGPA